MYDEVTIADVGLPILTHAWALMVIEQWGLFSVPHLLWHEISVYNGHLRRPVTFTPTAEHLAVEESIPFFINRYVDAGIRTSNPPHSKPML